MYSKNNIIYAEAGCVLRSASKGVIAYTMPADVDDIIEIAVPLDDVKIDGNLAVWGNGLCACSLEFGADFAYYKTKLIKSRYNLDDQMAVMLNGNDEEMEKMQRWRIWASKVAHCIVNLQSATNSPNCV